ncbi:VCBS repeat-containing protein [Sinomicrobium weinanense]|uniref:VCBS repeat-containing protein n=1 Tax=Sinomicrobium weinanense TaxID=2842200 RepID=A0A926JPQ2_9FLAO|nr:VCBS repeat-containing protein [Sinomicrobium weinanense]MBC9795178.1 VCBS repeat-containing protein [Sinomicrobium weinanense]MBU3121955.1 VCBS repeat-containing protein [Sinomicrobium weinanense]
MKYIPIILLVSCFLGCSEKERKLFTVPPPEETGINFANTLDTTSRLNILDYLYFYNGAGVAIGDIDNDGLPDIFLVRNQGYNKLYRNKGNMQFEDITEKAGVAGKSDWNTGVTMADVNGDGLLDIYVCAVVGINGFLGHNELYINNGDGTFTESAAEYGLDLENHSTMATFFDYDLDGDLDMYLLNHAVHSEESFGRADIRNKRNYESGDKLFRNDSGQFTDVSEEAGIYGGANGYGLGVAVSDFNMDGYPDIYVNNDFHEDDYYYLNNGDGTFTESLKKYFGHTSKFSMGNDAADINNDGFPDLLTLDMLPEDEKVLKSSAGDETVAMLNMRTEKLGYHYQYSRNMMHINRRGNGFSETALLSGIAATDWSWGALFTDLDQDGQQDLFVSNGIPKRPNDLDYIKYISDEQIRKKLDATRLVDNEALALMPSGVIPDYFFRGKADNTFEDKSGKWAPAPAVISNGSAFADLDNDGDMDIITNNLNTVATVYQNKVNDLSSDDRSPSGNNYLKIHLRYKNPNIFGIGSKVISYHNGEQQLRELFPARGFQSTSQPIIHFGYGEQSTVDSIIVLWPDKTSQTLYNIPTGQNLEVKAAPDRKPFDYTIFRETSEQIFTRVPDKLGIDFTHRENHYIDSDRQKLIPYNLTDRGPATAIGDLDGDGREDIFFGGSKREPATVYIQRDSGFVKTAIPTVQNDSVAEGVAALIADLSGNGRNELFVASGGGEYRGKAEPLADRLYSYTDTTFDRAGLPEYYGNGIVVKAFDHDNNGFPDLFVGNHAVSNDFGKIPGSFLLKNKGGTFSITENEALRNAGMVTDAIWTDFDGDGTTDLIVVGEWMAPSFFKNNGKGLNDVTGEVLPEKLNGLWQSIIPFDIDGDGDTDYLLGNWGTNTKFKASVKYPMQMYYDDFDNNGSTETVITTEKDGKYYPLAGMDELSGQMVSLIRKKFTTYRDFAGKTLEEIFDKKLLQKAKLLEVHTLQSGYLKNDGGKFAFHPFGSGMQLTPVTAFAVHDFDGDGKKEALAAGNYFGVQPYHGRFDGFPGALIKDGNTVIPAHQLGMDLSGKAVRHLNIIKHNNKTYLIVTINNDHAEVYAIP